MRRLFIPSDIFALTGLMVLSLVILILTTSCGKKVTTTDDTTPPTVQILSPTNNSVVSDTVEISVEAKDNKKVARVEFYIDSQLSFTDSLSPWVYDWITYLYDDSTSHAIFAVAYDQAGNRDTSSVVNVLVQVSAGFFFISDYLTPGMAYDVFVQGNYAYVADGEEGLRIINVQNPANPYSEGNFNTSGFAKAVFVSGSYAYVADGEHGLQIVSISIPSSPDSAGLFDTPGSGEDVFVSGNFAYLADGGEGLQIIDITDPNNPDSAAQFSGISVKGVFVSGAYAYLATADGLQILDVSDPTDPSIAGFHHMPFYKGNRIYVEGDYAYLAASEGGLHIFDVFDPYNPVELDTVYKAGGKAYGVFVKDDFAYVAFEDDGVHVIDVSNPYQIRFVNRFNTEGKSLDLFVSGKIIYVADYSSLVILRLSGS